MRFIIVYDKKKETEKFADWLKAEVSKNDNVETAKWSEKQYQDNEPTLSSNEYIVFMGNTKVGKNISQSPSFEIKYNQINMKYGWLGKQAVLFIDSKYKYDEDKVNQFINLYNKAFENEIKETKTTDSTKKGIAKIADKVDKTIKNVPVAGKVAAVVVGVPLFGTVAAVASGTYLVGDALKNHFDQTKLNADAKKLLLQEFIKNGLKEFLKIKDASEHE